MKITIGYNENENKSCNGINEHNIKMEQNKDTINPTSSHNNNDTIKL